jgi:hypothetical protein
MITIPASQTACLLLSAIVIAVAWAFPLALLAYKEIDNNRK